MKKKPSGKRKKSAYAAAGVDIDEMTGALRDVRTMIRNTATKDVLSSIGSFGGLYQAPGKGKILAASTDGVGTKLKVALMASRHDTVGQDLVNHCVNDILVQGAKPFFFLDYLGTSRLDAAVFKEVIKGICKACRENSCAMLGGETAEMPGLYPEGEYDLAGTIVGAVDKKRIVTGRKIRPGDIVLGLRSTGLHTNGYSLARKVIFETAGLNINDTVPGTGRTAGDVLLSVHRSYLRYVTALMPEVRIHGMAHITGGGLIDNLPRVLPSNCSVVIDPGSWKVPPIFRFIAEAGGITEGEMYRVFNMGIGYVVILPEDDAAHAVALLKEAGTVPSLVGYVEKGPASVTFAGGTAGALSSAGKGSRSR
ncbi:MAG: phosphoribosylformylglycinamidine cyclo-ligase [Kiritimatiellia bacterium]